MANNNWNRIIEWLCTTDREIEEEVTTGTDISAGKLSRVENKYLYITIV